MRHTVLYRGVPIAAFAWADAEISTHRLEDVEFTRAEAVAEALPGYDAIRDIVEGGWRAMFEASTLRPIAQPHEWDRNTAAQVRHSELVRELELVDADGLPVAASLAIASHNHLPAPDGFIRLSVVLGHAPAAVPALAPAAQGGETAEAPPDRP